MLVEPLGHAVGVCPKLGSVVHGAGGRVEHRRLVSGDGFSDGGRDREVCGDERVVAPGVEVLPCDEREVEQDIVAEGRKLIESP